MRGVKSYRWILEIRVQGKDEEEAVRHVEDWMRAMALHPDGIAEDGKLFQEERNEILEKEKTAG